MNPATDPKIDLERRTSAMTLSDMEMFIFPELIYSLMLANMMSPILWRWREDPWFKGIQKKSLVARVNRLKQYIMDHYAFNLDLDTWGMTTKERELARFEGIVDPATLAQSNALFGYEGDKYYFDIDIRRHFGLDKYEGNVIPYWKTETIEAMTAFDRRPGYTTGAGECVSLSTLYAAALFVVLGIPLRDIYLMATPLHSQNFIDIADGIVTNNRRIVTKTMWFNGTAISGQARRSMEHERITLVAHETGTIHIMYPEATIAPEVFADFSAKLAAYLSTPLTPEMLGNFLRQSPESHRCFVVRGERNGAAIFLPLARAFQYERDSSYKVTDATLPKLLEEVEQEEFTGKPCERCIVLNDLQAYLAEQPVDIHAPADVQRLLARFKTACLNAEQAVEPDRLLPCRAEAPGRLGEAIRGRAGAAGPRAWHDARAGHRAHRVVARDERVLPTRLLRLARLVAHRGGAVPEGRRGAQSGLHRRRRGAVPRRRFARGARPRDGRRLDLRGAAAAGAAGRGLELRHGRRSGARDPAGRRPARAPRRRVPRRNRRRAGAARRRRRRRGRGFRDGQAHPRRRARDRQLKLKGALRCPRD